MFLISAWIFGLGVAHADVLAIGTEPLGHGDDRVGKRLEDVVRADPSALLRCRSEAASAVPEPFRFVGLTAYFRTNGTIRKVRVDETTGNEALDACVSGVIAGLEVAPPPAFNDRMNVAITWISTEPAATP